MMERSIPRRRDVMRHAFMLAALPFARPQAWAANKLRIVAAGGAITETLFALNAQADLVGVDTTSRHPLSAQRLPSVGYMRSLSVEGVLSLAPSHVIATEDAGPPAVLRQLGESGVKVVILDGQHHVEGMLTRITRLGSVLGKEAQASALVNRLTNDWAATLTHVQAGRATRDHMLNGRPIRILFVLSHSLSQVMVAGTGSAAHSMIEYIGAQNAMSGTWGLTGYKPLTAEAAIAAAPDLILVTDQGLQAAGGVSGLMRLPGLADTPAGRARRVVAMDAPLLLGFGPRMPLAVRQLSDACTQALASATPATKERAAWAP